VQLRVRPRLELRFSGSGVLGAPLRVAGRLTPPGAGRLSLTVGGEPRSITPDSSGAFSTRVSSRREGELCATLRLAPNDGFANAARRVCTAIETPGLRMGARGAAVRYLESALKQRAYALDGPPSTRYAADTRDAVYAFEKVEGLARDGAAGPQVWRRLLSARRPQPRHHGTHIDVDKTRQVLFEVRNGRVVRVIHVSTGATGNTPLGRFQVYRKDSGFNSLGMYDSLYFLRGFAIHGYASVPPYPASHGCVREPLWFAHGLYTRWSVGATIWIVA
jgi:lipoprotein-anchoring transpeptidase ErfK/SrfK